MGIPQIAMIALYMISLGVSLSEHGKKTIKTENFLTSLISVSIQLTLLWWGGFFGG